MTPHCEELPEQVRNQIGSLHKNESAWGITRLMTIQRNTVASMVRMSRRIHATDNRRWSDRTPKMMSHTVQSLH